MIVTMARMKVLISAVHGVHLRRRRVVGKRRNRITLTGQDSMAVQPAPELVATPLVARLVSSWTFGYGAV